MTFQENISSYLVTTTIHGLRYLYEGQNWMEKITWFLVIAASIAGSIITIRHSIDEANKEPILTTLHTAKIENVPFPAVTINGDVNIDHWGFTEKVLNALAFYWKPSSSKKVCCNIK